MATLARPYFGFSAASNGVSCESSSRPDVEVVADVDGDGALVARCAEHGELRESATVFDFHSASQPGGVRTARKLTLNSWPTGDAAGHGDADAAGGCRGFILLR